MMKNSIKLVVLDFDDTLCMNQAACYQLENRIAQKMGYPLIEEHIHKATWGMPLELAVEQRVPGVDKQEYLALLTEELPILANQNKVDFVKQENLAVLDTLKKMGKELAILTSRKEGELTHLMSVNHPLSSRIEKFYYHQDDSFNKPDKRVFLEILNDFNVSSKEALYIGDSLGDAACAKGAGLSFIATLESGLKNPTDFECYQVDAYIHQFSELLSFFN